MRQVSLDYFRAIVWERCPELATIQGGVLPLKADICCSAAKSKYFFA